MKTIGLIIKTTENDVKKVEKPKKSSNKGKKKPKELEPDGE